MHLIVASAPLPYMANTILRVYGHGCTAKYLQCYQLLTVSHRLISKPNVDQVAASIHDACTIEAYVQKHYDTQQYCVVVALHHV